MKGDGRNEKFYFHPRKVESRDWKKMLHRGDEDSQEIDWCGLDEIGRD